MTPLAREWCWARVSRGQVVGALGAFSGTLTHPKVFIFGRFMRNRIGPVLYLLATVALIAVVGVPEKRDLLAIWVLLGLFCFSLADLRGLGRGVVLEWLPFIAILIAYDSLRGSAGHLFGVHYLPQLQADQALFGTAPTVTLQHWLWHGHAVWYDAIPFAVYLSHFLATPIVAAVLFKRDRQRFRVFAVFVATLSLLGLVTYALYPAAPPWMASQAGLLAPVTRIVPQVFPMLGLHQAGSLFEHGYNYANDVAAVPSLHAAFALLIAITLWPRRRKWLRPFVALYPLAMALTLIYTGEHYFSDVALGWTYTVAALFAARAVRRWWAGRDSARVPAPAPEPAYADRSS